jgi:TRAP-type C4-dicarboxylate transport system substrate-binding protein
MKRVSVVALAVVVCFLAICFSSTSYAQQKVVTLKFSNFFPAPHKNSIIAEQWCREVEKRTNGKVKINYFPGATLTPANQTFDSVEKGICDIGESVLAYTRGKFPLTEVIDLPLGGKSGTALTRMINEYFKKFQPKEFANVKVLYLHAHGPGLLHFGKKTVTKMEDVKGMKIRSTGLSAKLVQALGGAPVGMPMTESYDALSKGVAEGIMAPYEAMKGWKLAEVVGGTVENFGSSYSTGMFVVMNKAKWNALPPDVQKVIEQVSQEWIGRQGKVWDDIDKEGKDLMISMKKKIVSLSKEEDARWAKQVQPILDEYVKTTKAKGLPGDQVLKFAQDFLAKQK